MYIARPHEPYFNRLNSPHRLPNRLQRAIYNGRLHKVQQIVAQPAIEDAASNIYRMCDSELPGMSLLFLAVACDQLAIANILLRVYELDFRALERFHARHGIEKNKWVGRTTVLVACGEKVIAHAKRLSADAGSKEGLEGLLVLCKQSNLDDEPQIFSCDRHLIDSLLSHGSQRFESVADAQYLAATRGHRALWLRMLRLDDHRLDLAAYHAQLLQLTGLRSGRAAERRAYYAELERDLGDRFSLTELLRTATNDVLMLPFMHSTQMDLFEAFVRERAALIGCSANLAEVLQPDPAGRNFFETFVAYDCVPAAMRVVRLFGADLLACGGYEQRPLILLFIRGESQTDAEVVEWIVERWEQKIEVALRADILRAMFATDWADGLRELYRRFSSQTRGILFNDATIDEDFELLMEHIEACRFAVVEFAIAEHSVLFSDGQRCARALTNCAYARRSHPLLLRLLRLPAADVLRPSELHQNRLPLGPALRHRHLSNFWAMWATLDAAGEDRARIRAAMRHRDSDGRTLLNEAVWSKEPVADEGPWPFRAEPQVRIEIVDSDDDEAAGDRKRSFNATDWSLRRIDEVVQPTAEYYARQELEYRQVWDMLLAAGGDAHQRTNGGQTLLHEAVLVSNGWLVERLIGLGVDATLRNSDGRSAEDLCKDERIAELLAGQTANSEDVS